MELWARRTGSDWLMLWPMSPSNDSKHEEGPECSGLNPLSGELARLVRLDETKKFLVRPPPSSTTLNDETGGIA